MISRQFFKKKLRILVFMMAGMTLLQSVCGFSSESKRIYRLKLRWQSVPGVEQYKIQIGRERNFTNVIEEALIEEPKWTWEFNSDVLNSKGRVFFRVASVNSDGEVGEFSSPEILSLPEEEASIQEEFPKLDKVSKPQPSLPSTQPSPPEIKVAMPVEKSERHRFLQWSGIFDAGLGNFEQKSNDSTLKSVSNVAPFFQQKAALSLDVFDVEDKLPPRRLWSAQIQFQYEPFRGAIYPPAFRQPNVANYLFSAETLRWTGGNSPWHFGFGVVLDRSFRWERTDFETVDAAGAFSLGPVIHLMWQPLRSWSFSPAEVGLMMGAPLTGVISGGYWGVNSSLWAEWSILDFGKLRTGVRLEGDGTYSSWSVPNGTVITSWSIWFGFTARFRGDS
jgi:hypothetical protein